MLNFFFFFFLVFSKCALTAKSNLTAPGVLAVEGRLLVKTVLLALIESFYLLLHCLFFFNMVIGKEKKKNILF